MKKFKHKVLLLSIFASVFFQFAQAQNVQNSLNFIQNKNQWNDAINYKIDLKGGHVYFSNNYFKYVYYNVEDLNKVHHAKEENYLAAYSTLINCYAYDVTFEHANQTPEIKPNNKKSFYHNYFLGNDASKWAGNVPVFESLLYKEMYHGIDVKTFSEGVSFKYDIIVHPTGNVNDIVLKYKGVTPKLLPNGNLQIPIGFNTLEETAPLTYQIINGQKIIIASKYSLSNNDELSFVFPNGYNKDYDLVIDPVLTFATYSSSTATTYGFSATYDLAGSLYAGGECFGVGWASTLGAFQVTYGGSVDAGINKYTPTGNALIYATYYGGNGSDLPNNMVVNISNELAMTGSTSSSNLPITAGCFDNTLAGSADAYVVKFNATGTALLGATYVGGSSSEAQNSGSLSPNYGDFNRGEIFYDNNGDIVVATSTNSNDFPTTAGAFQTTSGGGQDACFFKVNSACSNLIFSTYIGGTNQDAAFSIARTSAGNWVLCGGTNSANFPTTVGSLAPTAQGGTDGFVCILNSTATSLLNSSYIGTSSYDHAFKVQVDPNDTVYVCGQTATGSNFLVSPGLYNVPNSTIYFQKIVPDLSAVMLSTRIGQTSNLVPTAFLKDNCGNVYFSGFQANGSLALTPNAFQTTPGGFWLSVISGDFTSLVYATYMGASGDHVDGGTSRFDPQGIVYQSVCTNSSNQYQSPGCLSPTNLAGSWDVASFKFDFQLAGVQASLYVTPNDSGCAPHTVVFNNTSVAGLNYKWYFGDGDSSSLASPTHTYLNPGTYTVKLLAYNQFGCFSIDSAFTSIKVISSVDAGFTFNTMLGCKDDSVSFLVNNPNQGSSTFITWDFGDGIGSTVMNPTHTYYTQGVYTVTCYAGNGFCFDTTTAIINLNHPINAQFVAPDSICSDGTAITLSSLSVPAFSVNHEYYFGNGDSLNAGSSMFSNYVYPDSGNYVITLVVTDTLGCKDTSKQSIFVDQQGFVDLSVTDSVLCVGDPVFFNDSIVSHTLNYYWDFGDGAILNNVHNPTHSWENPGQFWVTLVGQYKVCNPVKDSILFTVDDYPLVNLGPDTMICPGLTGTILLTNTSNPGSIGTWSTGEISNSILATQAGRYWLKSMNGACSTTDSIWIKRDCYINIPNSFSPNGDGLNDFFFPRELLSSGVSTFKMSIFNRWGEQIFNTTSIEGRGWDGKYNEKAQPMGVYVYVIDVEFENKLKKNYKGNLTLLR